MVTDQQVRRLFKLVQTEKNFGIAAIKAGMDEKTARKYRKLGIQTIRRMHIAYEISKVFGQA
jgi:hypothetical protein